MFATSQILAAKDTPMSIMTLQATALDRDDLPLNVKLAKPMPMYAGGDEPTAAKWGTHVPTGPGDNHDDINTDYSMD